MQCWAKTAYNHWSLRVSTDVWVGKVCGVWRSTYSSLKHCNKCLRLFYPLADSATILQVFFHSRPQEISDTPAQNSQCSVNCSPNQRARRCRVVLFVKHRMEHRMERRNMIDPFSLGVQFLLSTNPKGLGESGPKTTMLLVEAPVVSGW